MRPTIRLGRIRGIEIGIHWSLLVIGVLLAGTLAASVFPDLVPKAGGSYWAAAVLATALFFASILAHELSHALVAFGGVSGSRASRCGSSAASPACATKRPTRAASSSSRSRARP